MADENKLKALAAAMAKIEKDFGKGAIMKLGDEKIENVDVIPSGSLGLDIALGVAKKVEVPESEVDAVTGATLTSNGVSQMLKEGLKPFMEILKDK